MKTPSLFLCSLETEVTDVFIITITGEWINHIVEKNDVVRFG
jgi:hypothetical protein